MSARKSESARERERERRRERERERELMTQSKNGFHLCDLILQSRRTNY